MSKILTSPAFAFSAAIALRAALFSYGLYQDSTSPVKYTDIDYFVFTDAARFTAWGRSPYERETYRYTPLLAWLLIPTAWPGWFSFGKILFAAADVLAGFLIYQILRSEEGMARERAVMFANIWLLNPMVATISTRGSSEGLLGVMVVALLWAVTKRRVVLAGVLLGLAVHFKIYPFIYGVSILWSLEDKKGKGKAVSGDGIPSVFQTASNFFNANRVALLLASLATFMILNYNMYNIYGWPFVQNNFLHHATRLDHRHNFSPYNTLLYLNSSPSGSSSLKLESLAFLPQLLLSAVAIPLSLAKKDLPSTMLAQTFAFVTFNKVCTSQYFLWYMVFLPFYLSDSSFLRRPALGITAIALWVGGQALWLQQGYNLEFLGRSTFVPGLWLSSILFFLVNIWLLGIFVTDISYQSRLKADYRGAQRLKKHN
ncbi:MAG: GPI mannosyltransferase 1 [Vezdaea acicularis]|nr:MAG: GPI mannosyltransferase 1 [Vezdaea acicularis]